MLPLHTQVPSRAVNHFHSPYSNVIIDNIVNDFYWLFIALSNTVLTQETVFYIWCTIPCKKSFTLYGKINTSEYEIKTLKLLPPAKRSLGQGNIFTDVCHSFCSWWAGLTSQHASQVTRPGGLPAEGSASIRGGGLHLGGLGRAPKDTWNTTGYVQQVAGTHPTIMHCCDWKIHWFCFTWMTTFIDKGTPFWPKNWQPLTMTFHWENLINIWMRGWPTLHYYSVFANFLAETWNWITVVLFKNELFIFRNH